MPRPHFYKNLDRDSKLTIDIDMRSLAERVETMNYGTHRFLSHLIDVRRERLAERIKEYAERGHHDVADNVRAEGDQLANGIERMLRDGLY